MGFVGNVLGSQPIIFPFLSSTLSSPTLQCSLENGPLETWEAEERQPLAGDSVEFPLPAGKVNPWPAQALG